MLAPLLTQICPASRTLFDLPIPSRLVHSFLLLFLWSKPQKQFICFALNNLKSSFAIRLLSACESELTIGLRVRINSQTVPNQPEVRESNDHCQFLGGHRMFPNNQFGHVNTRGFQIPVRMFQPQQEMFQQQYMLRQPQPLLSMRMPMAQFPQNIGFLQASPIFMKGNQLRTPHHRQGGNNFNSRRSEPYPQQHHPRNNRDKNKNNQRRKSEERSEPYNSLKSSFNVSTTSSTSMHMKLVDGAKPILHVPGQPCERITKAIVQYYNEYHQSEEDLKHKIVLSNCLYAIVRDIFPGCRLFIVGSSLSGFGTHTSDMDLCLLVTQMHDIDQKFEAVHILNAIHKSLKSCTFIKSSQVIKAKVPILKFTDSMKSIECDLNINNGVGIRNTHLLKYYCLSDTRVAPLMLFIKFWARFHDINDAHKRTISSYSLALMLIHYLQVSTPPVLPCLQKLFPERFEASVDLRKLRLDEPLEYLTSKNTDSLGKLFQGFLDYYAFKFRPECEVISVREGQVLQKHMVQSYSSDPTQWKYLCIEEPFDMSNTARSVFDPYVFQRVRTVFMRSAETLKKEGDVASVLSQPF